MKWLENIARKYITKKDGGVSSKIKNQRKNIRNYWKLEIEADKILTDFLEEYEKEINLQSRFKIGDRAIMNKYSIKYQSENGWDSGASLICREIKDRPVFVKITNTYVTDTWAADSIERFIDRLDLDILEEYVNNGALIEKYKKYYSNSFPNELHKSLGLYVNVKFEIEGEASINPQWGLNEYSFHKVGSKEAKITEMMWNREIELEIDEDRIRKERKTWEKDRNSVSTIKIRPI